MASVKCPHCGRMNPAAGFRCDCGYDFASGMQMASLLWQGDSRKKPGATRPSLAWNFGRRLLRSLRRRAPALD